MKNFYILTDAINYIEDNLCNEIIQKNIAKKCFCSLSNLQKVFKYVFNISLKEYITKRRLTYAAKELVETNESILNISLKYQYKSPEVFTRAFSKVWRETPSVYREKWKFTCLFPKLEFNYNGGMVDMPCKKFDITQLYEELKLKKGTYILLFDIKGMDLINNISRELGDKAIIEALRRIDEKSTEQMILFRIGGDEFTLVTGYDNIEKAKELAKSIVSQNEKLIEYKNFQTPLSMRVGCIKLDKTCLKYDELFEKLNESINRDKTLSGF
ncbi:helix-turn-helix domain-containing protein [Sedimentibacter sp. zth1]|uniref:helix-turn-helix domain-containing protein n=1 Tax=Sedimentibacter sp. zth1 TaxID=2816908 RepID=UPI001A938367|nr:helix-turn-helix domain-containing protein [Sedimentibacter sp. zth1]QSX05155.1 helix-turn-helix domain-containing protein [Sedimentibacter sp. zth1]